MKIVAFIGLLALLAFAGAWAGGVSFAGKPQTKVIVCKYVGKPGVDERLQTGNNPISVSVNALEGRGFTGSFPFEFSDAQGRSVAVRFAIGNEQGSLSDCPGVTTSSTTTTTTTTPTTTTTTTTPTGTINPQSTFTAGAFCVISEQRYRVVGTVNGDIASVNPQFIAGDKVGPTIVIVTLGSESAAKVVITDGTCVSTSTTTTTPGGGGSGGGGTTSTTTTGSSTTSTSTGSSTSSSTGTTTSVIPTNTTGSTTVQIGGATSTNLNPPISAPPPDNFPNTPKKTPKTPKTPKITKNTPNGTPCPINGQKGAVFSGKCHPVVAGKG